MIRTKIKIDTRNLRRATGKLRSLTKESKADLANSSAKFVALHAYRYTDRTTASAIREELRQTRGPYTKAELILAARARRTGNWPTGKYGIQKEARRFIALKAASAGWLRVGFLPAIRLFGGRGAQAKRFRRFPGQAGKARRTTRKSVAFIEHFDQGFIERHPRLLQSAVDRQTGFMERLAEKKARENIRRARR